MKSFARFLAVLQIYSLILMPLQGYAVAVGQGPEFLPTRYDPNVMMALSVEWPTAETAAYTDNAASDPGGLCPGLVSDSLIGNLSPNVGSGGTKVGVCYYEAQTYLGYFDPLKCYSYDTINQYFSPVAKADPATHRCSGAWAGNLLNWATMTTVDEFRWAMTGGARDADTPASGAVPGLTVLKRSWKARGPRDYVMQMKRISVAATSVGAVSVPGVASSTVTPTTHDTTMYFGNQGGNLFIYIPTPSSSTGCGAGSLLGLLGLGGLGGLIGSVLCELNAALIQPLLGPAIGNLLTTLNILAAPTDSTGQLSALASMQVRVKVCDGSVGMEANCTPYANGSTTTWKPTGLMQTYASAMRFGVSGYLFDKSQAHNGGVLRSNMKYVGGLSKDPVSGITLNPNTEWDSNGVLIPNPSPADAYASGLSPSSTDTTTCTTSSNVTSCSGVINYLNNFGYAAQDYMQFDVVSELYYEALRYFVNPANGPTTSYVTAPWNFGGVTASEKDGFPVITHWKDPVQYACQQNVIVTIGDTNTWCDYNLPGSSLNLSCSGNFVDHLSASLANNGGLFGTSVPENWANVTSFTNSVGAYEGIGTIGSLRGGGPPDTYYIAGLAWWAHTHNFRDATKNPTTGYLMSSYFVDVREPHSWGTPGGTAGPTQYYLAAKYGGFTTHDTSTVTNLKPLSSTDWASSSNPSGVQNYLYGNQPLTLVSNLNKLFASLTNATGSQDALGVNSSVLTTSDKIYQGAATTTDNSGHLRAFDVSANPATLGQVSSTSIDAATFLSPALIKPDARVIYTYNPVSGQSVPFSWTGSGTALSPAQQLALNTNANGAVDNQGQARVAYLRGDGSSEGTSAGQFRPRSATKLGDIIDSTPVFVGRNKPGPSAGSRSGVVYVGANDGMLHAFSAGAAGDTTTTPGTTMMQELFAYVPSMVLPKLPDLTAQAYTHEFFVDGNPTVVEAAVGSTPKTVLGVGLRGGGAGIVALDVTSPDDVANGSASPLLWEFSNADDPDLGYTFSDPQIVQTKAKDTSGNYRWALVVGNGYNNALLNSASSGQASVFVLFLDHQLGHAWTLGTDYVKLTTRVAAASPSAPNGMATPTMASADGSGQATVLYAGDLYGNLWKFDISSALTGNWAAALDSALPASTPLYVAKTPAGVLQPITTAPDLAVYPNGGYVVLFGTGQALSPADMTSTALQSFYGVLDNNSNTPIPSRDVSSTILVQQQILTSYTTSGNSYRAVSTNPVRFSGTVRGWYLDFLAAPGATPNGERLVFNPGIFDGLITFTTVIPGSGCQDVGSSWNMLLDPYSGAAPSYAVLDVNGSGTFNALDALTLVTTNTSSGPSYSVSGVNPTSSATTTTTGTNGSTTTTSLAYAACVQTGGSDGGIQAPGIHLLLPGGCPGGAGSSCSQVLQTGTTGAITAYNLKGQSSQRLSWREISHG